MSYEIDKLEIVIETQTAKTNRELDKLISKLKSVSHSLRNLAAAANQINRASKAMRDSAKSADTANKSFQELANGVEASSRNVINYATLEKSRLAEQLETVKKITEGYKEMKIFSETASPGRIVQDYATSVKNTEMALSRLRSRTEEYQSAMAGVSDLSSETREKQDQIRIAYNNVETSVDSVTKALAKLRTSESSESKGSAISKLLGEDATREVVKFNSEYSKSVKIAEKLNMEAMKTPDELRKAEKATENLNKRAEQTPVIMGKANNTLLKLRRTMLNVISLVYVFKKAWKGISLAMEFGETLNLFETVFRKIGKDAGEGLADDIAEGLELKFLKRAEKFRDDLSNNLALNPNDVMNYMSNFAQMANSMGVTTDAAYAMSESLTALGADVASLFNLDVDTAMGRLKAGLSGQIRPMRMLGVDISKTTLAAIALEHGITDSLESMSAAAKVQLRYLAMTKQLEIAMTDMAQTINSPANQLRVLKQQWENLMRTIGSVAIPLMSKLLPIVNGLTMSLISFFKVLATSAGYEEADFTKDEVALEGLEDGADEADESLQQLRRTLGGFDELNILGDTSLNDFGGDGYDILDEAILKSNQEYMSYLNLEIEKMNKLSDEWKKTFDILLPKVMSMAAHLGILLLAVKAFGVAKGILVGISTAVTILNSSFIALLANPIVLTIAAVVAVLGLLYSQSEAFRESVNKLAKGVMESLGVFMQFGSYLWDLMQPAIERLKSAFDEFGQALAKLMPIIKFLIDVIIILGAAVMAVLATLITGLAEIATVILKGFNWLLNGLGWLAEAIVNMFKGIPQFFKNLWEGTKNFFSDFWDSMISGFKITVDAFKTIAKTIVNIITSPFKTAWENIKGMFSGIKDIFSDILNADNFKDAFKAIINGLVKGINAVINEPINSINKVLGKIKDINILGVSPFKWIPEIPTANIPMLAQGGIVGHGQMFIANEAGPEMVGKFGSQTGVINNQQIVQAVSEGVARAVASVMGSQGDREQNVNVYLDSRQITNSVEQNRRQRGVSIMRGGNK